MIIGKCKSCDTDIEENTNFCGICGTPVRLLSKPTGAEPQIPLAISEPETGKKAINIPSFKVKAVKLKPVKLKAARLKAFALPVIAIIIAVAFIMAATTAIQTEQYAKIKDSLYILQLEDGVAIIQDGEIKKSEGANPTNTVLQGKLVQYSTNLERNKAAALISVDLDIPDLDEAHGATLYLISDTIKPVSDNVYNYWLASSGKAIAYAKEYDSATGMAELWHYTGSKPSLITKEFYADSGCAISPKGNALAYVTSDGYDLMGVVWNGKAKNLGENVQPIAVADKAKHVYYSKNGIFYVQKDADKETREKLGEDVQTIFANKDLTEIAYNSGFKSYLSINGGKKESLSGTIGGLTLPEGTSSMYSGNGLTIYGITKFANSFYYNDDNGYIGHNGSVYINDDYETTSIIKNASKISLANNGKALAYIRNSKAYKLKDAFDEPDELIAGDIIDLIPIANGKAYYFINDEKELYFQKGKGKPLFITDDYTRIISSLFNGKSLYYIRDGELCVTDGGKPRLTEGIAGEVQNISANLLSVLVESNEDDSIFYYYSTDGVKFELIGQGMNFSE